jgi:hypothetical protein
MGFNEDQQAAHFTNINVLVKEALRHKCWIYNTNEKIWYSPEEFMAKYEHSSYNQAWFAQFKIMNPMAGLKAAEIQAQKLNEKKLAFQQRVFEYYQNKLK